VETHRLLAKAYEAKGDFDKALQEWQGPLQDEPDAPENIQRLSSNVKRGARSVSRNATRNTQHVANGGNNVQTNDWYLVGDAAVSIQL
jgi:hypothetical protein